MSRRPNELSPPMGTAERRAPWERRRPSGFWEALLMTVGLAVGLALVLGVAWAAFLIVSALVMREPVGVIVALCFFVVACVLVAALDIAERRRG